MTLVINPMKKILLVDDDYSVRQAIRAVLESQGMECAEVENGAAALKWLEQDNADLIVTDNQMPVLTGLDFIERLKEQANFHKPPIILLSGNLGDQDKFRALKAGVYAILDKPCNFSEFLSLVTLALEKGQ